MRRERLTACLLLAAAWAGAGAAVRAAPGVPARDAAVEELTDAFASYLLGLSLQEADDHAGAARALRQAVAAGGAGAEVHLALAESCLELGLREEAERAALEATRLDPESGEAHRLLGRLRLERAEVDGALSALRRARELAPDDLQLRIEIAQIHRRSGSDSLAVAEFRALGPLAAFQPALRLRVAGTLEEMGDESGSRENYEALLADEEVRYPALLGLARWDLRAGRPEKALERYRGAFALQPDNQDLAREILSLQLRREDWPGAEEAGRAVLRIDPGDTQSAMALASVLAERGRFPEAVATLDSLPAAAQEHPGMRNLRARLRLELGDPAGAAADLREAIRLEPEWTDPLISLGVIHLGSGENAPADTLLARAALLAPDDPEPHLLLGVCRARQRRFEDALVSVRRSLALRPDEPRALFEEGSILERLGRFEEAERPLRRVLELEPENALAHNYLGYMLADRGVRLEEALRHIEEAVRRDPDNGYFVDSLGWVYFRLGQLERAQETLERAVGLADDAEIHAHLAAVYSARGMGARAKEHWRRAAELEPSNEEWARRLEETREKQPR